MGIWPRLPVIACLTAAISACAPAPPDLQAEQAALMQVSREWAQAAATGDAERIASYWADDAVVMPPDQPAIVGKAAILEFVRASLAIPGFSVTWEPEQASVAGSGDIGYLIERNQFTLKDASGTLLTLHGKSATVWRKDSTGAWKCVVDIWNDNPPPATPASTGTG
jgi:uncharacterized protein (TIGR02246 family)